MFNNRKVREFCSLLMVRTLPLFRLTLNSETSWTSKNYLTVHYFVLASLISRSLQRSSFIPCLCQTSYIFVKVRVEDAGVILWILTCCVWHFDCLTWMRSGQSLFRSGTLRIYHKPLCFFKSRHRQVLPVVYHLHGQTGPRFE